MFSFLSRMARTTMKKVRNIYLKRAEIEGASKNRRCHGELEPIPPPKIINVIIFVGWFVGCSC